MPKIDTIEELMLVLNEHPQWLEALRTRLLTRELIELPRRFAEFAASVDQNFAQAEHRVDGIEQTIGGMEQTISGMGERMDGMEQTISGMGERMDGMEQTISGMGERMDGMQQTISGMGERMDGMQQTIGGMQRTMGEMNERMDTFATKDQQQKIVDRLGRLKGFMAERSARADAHGIAMDMGLRRPRLLSRAEAAELAYSPALAHLSRGERISFRKADILIEAADEAASPATSRSRLLTPPTSATQSARFATPSCCGAPQAARPALRSPMSAWTTASAPPSSRATSTCTNSPTTATPPTSSSASRPGRHPSRACVNGHGAVYALRHI